MMIFFVLLGFVIVGLLISMIYSLGQLNQEYRKRMLDLRQRMISMENKIIILEKKVEVLKKINDEKDDRD